MSGTGLTAIFPPFDLAVPLRDLAAAQGRALYHPSSVVFI